MVRKAGTGCLATHVHGDSSHVEHFQGPGQARHEPEELLAVFVPLDRVEGEVGPVILAGEGS